MFEAAFFDFGGVVTTSIHDAFGGLDAALGLPNGTAIAAMREEWAEENASFHRLEKGTLGEAEFYAGFRERLERIAGRSLDWPDDPMDVRRALFKGLGPNEEMLDAVRRISAHYPVGMITNNVREWGAWRDHYPMEIFRVVIDSCEVGLRKPDPEIYRLACERLGVRPEASVFVDDFDVNVEGAKAFGMRAILFTTTAAVLQELRPLFPKAFS